MIFVGIDPGLSGAVVALYPDGRIFRVWDTPVLTFEKMVRNKKTGQMRPKIRREPDRVAAVRILKTIQESVPELGEIRLAIEDVHAMPLLHRTGPDGQPKQQGQGAVSAFTFGKGYGIWLGILAALDISHLLVPPQRWKGQLMAGMGKQKDASRILGQQIWGSQIDLSKVMHHGRADAALIAEYRRRIG